MTPGAERRAPASRRAAAVLAAVLAVAAHPAAAAGPALGEPGGGVIWRSMFGAPADTSSADARTLAAAAAWRAARTALASGDTLGAEPALADPALPASVWAWESARQRAELALARRDTLAAEARLAEAATAAWPEAERAAHLVQHARLAAARGDTTVALARARLAMRLYPGLAPAGAAVRLVEAVHAARGERLGRVEQLAAADVEVLRGDRAAAVRRLTALRDSLPAAERGRSALRLAELSRLQRRPREAAAWADSAERLGTGPAVRERAALERARVLRSERRGLAAVRAYEALLQRVADPEVRAAAEWELGREAQDRAEYRTAEQAFARVAGAGGRRAEEARVLAGLCAFARGAGDSALAHWSAAASEPGRFWEAVALRARARTAEGSLRDRTRADSLFAVLAARPGYRFHRAAARDSLARRGWPGEVAAAACGTPAGCPAAATARALLARGDSAEAMTLLQRWTAGDARVAGTRPRTSGDWLAAASLAYAAGRADLGTRYADRAVEAAGDSAALAWPLLPWCYPPAFEPLVRPHLVDSLGMDAALVWALMRQESRFDPRARSVSHALGLTQLLLPTAGDVARWLRDPPPTEERLFDPAIGARYGMRYLAHLLGRFDRRVAVALTTYNAGPGTLRADWRALLERGGEALFAEFASNADSQDYTRRILGFRQAYRELAPREGR